MAELEKVGLWPVIKDWAKYVADSAKLTQANKAIQSSLIQLSGVAKTVPIKAPSPFPKGVPGAPPSLLIRQYQLQSAGTKQFISQQQATALAVAQVGAKLKEVGQTNLENFKSQIKGTTPSVEKLGKTAGSGAAPSVDKLGKSLDKTSQKVLPFEKRLARAAYILGRVQFVAISSVAAIAAIGFPVKLAADFETQLTKIATLTNVPKGAVEGLRTDILALSKELAISPQKLAAGAYFVLSSGIKDAAVATEVLTAAAKASTIGLGETTTVANVLTSVMNAYGLAAGEAMNVTDSLVNIVKLGKGEPEDFAQALGFVIPFAAQLGVSFEQVGAALATMTNQGLSAQSSVTALKGIFTQVLSPSDESRRIFDSLGLSVEDFRKEIDQNFVKAMQHLMQVTKGNEEILAELFPDVRGLLGVFAAFGIQIDQTVANLYDLEHGAGVTDVALKEVEQTTNFRLRKAFNNFMVTLTEVGKAFVPFVESLAKIVSSTAVQNFIKSLALLFSSLLQVVQKLSWALGYFAAYIIGRVLVDVLRLAYTRITALQIKLLSLNLALGVTALILGPIIMPRLFDFIGGVGEANEEAEKFEKTLRDVALQLQVTRGLTEQEAGLQALVDLYRISAAEIARTRAEFAVLPEDRSIETIVSRAILAKSFKEVTATQDKLIERFKASFPYTAENIRLFRELGVTGDELAAIYGKDVIEAIRKSGGTLETLASQTAGALKNFEDMTKVASDLANALNSIQASFDALVGVQTAEEAALQVQITQYRILAQEIKNRATLQGRLLTPAEEDQVEAYENSIEGLRGLAEGLRLQRRLQADVAIVQGRGLINQQQLTGLIGDYAASLDPANALTKALQDALISADKLGMKPFIQGLFNAFPELKNFAVFNTNLSQSILPNVIGITRDVAKVNHDLAQSWVENNTSIHEFGSSLKPVGE